QLLPALNVGGQLVTLKFGRDQESEADSLGLRYMSKENYNPWAMLKVMEILKEASGGEGSSEWMSTHPLPETRIQRITQELQRDYAFTRDNPEYQFHEQRYRERFLRRLATRPPPSDPRASTPLAIDLSDPSAWCSLCAAQPSVAHSERQGP
ncbi:MAG TPA: M48 family metalloprotease, partial [Phycisphaerales bacterium]|nr:M48 family metalloprotease [Phycisphaerales bacterium]